MGGDENMHTIIAKLLVEDHYSGLNFSVSLLRLLN